MWSGPRNISTALMRSFGARSDAIVCDEPLYAHYLQHTGYDHPLAGEIIEQHDADWRSVAAWLSGPLPAGKTVFYQKHMAHHLLPHIERDWLAGFRHAFLIRDPSEMLTSLLEILPQPGVMDTGLPQQVELFEDLKRRGVAAPVVDSKELLTDPKSVLTQTCAALGIDFQESMLAWEAGPRPTDGCWGPHWYGNTLRSTGFAPYKPKEARVPDEFRELKTECQALYRRLHNDRIRA